MKMLIGDTNMDKIKKLVPSVSAIPSATVAPSMSQRENLNQSQMASTRKKGHLRRGIIFKIMKFT